MTSSIFPARCPGPFLVARALLRPGRTYDEAVDAFAPYDRIQEPNPKLRQDLVRLVEHAVHTRIPAYLLVNNRAEGSAPHTIAEVARLLPEVAAVIERRGLMRFAVISVVAALATIALKAGAYLLTGSIALLSDALESLVNLVAALAALVALWVAARPADKEHTYGHTKAEYFSSGFEGALILVAAVSILVAAARRLLAPQPIEDPAVGLAITAIASLLNFGVAQVLLRAGRRYESISLEADAQHLMSDVWTSLGVIGGVAAAALTGWHRLDAIVAIAVALLVIRAGVRLLRRSMLGLLDTSLPEESLAAITAILERHGRDGVRYHALRTRQAGARRFISFHILVPGHWTVQRGHDLLEEIEEQVRAAVPNSVVDTHLEPIEDPVSWEDTRLERPPQGDHYDVGGSQTSSPQVRSSPGWRNCAVPQPCKASSNRSGAPMQGSSPRL